MRMVDFLSQVLLRVSEIERRIDGMVKQGQVAEVDPKAGTVRLNLGGTQDEPFLSPPIPYAQVAGGLKVHAPPTVGQQMTVISGAGDFRQGLAVPMTWSDKNKAPNDKGDENTLTFGDVRIDLKGGELKVSIGGFSLSLTSSGATYTVGGVTHQITGDGVGTTGGSVKHDSKNIGSSHVHGGVVPGGSNTAPPAN